MFDGTRLVRVDRYQRMVKVLLEQKTKVTHTSALEHCLAFRPDYVLRQKKQSSGAAAENHEADDEESEMERRMGVDRLREAEEATTGDAWDQAKVERELKRRKIVPISPAFRIVVLANPPTIKQGTVTSHPQLGHRSRHIAANHVLRSSGVNWLTSEVITLFHFHHLAFNDVAFFDQKADILRTLFRDHPRGLEVLEKTLRYLIYRPAPHFASALTCPILSQL